MEEILALPSSDSDLLRGQRKRKYTTLGFILALNFTLGLASSLLGPLYPAEATKKGLTASVYGAVIGFSNLPIFFCMPLISIFLIQGKLGFWRFEIRHCLLFVFFSDGVVLLLFGFLDFVNSISEFTVFSFVLRGIDGIGSAGTITLTVALCLTFPNRKALVVGLQELAFYGGLAIGPLLGEKLFQLGGFISPFTVVGLVEICLSVLACFFLPSIPNPPNTQESVYEVLHSFRKLFRVPSFSLFVVLIILTGSGWGFLSATLESNLEQFNLSPIGTGLVFSIAGIPLLSAPLWGFLVDWTDRSKLVTFIGSLSAALGAMLIGPVSFLPLSPSLECTSIGVFLVGIGEAALLGSNFYNLGIGTRKLNTSSDSVANVIGVSCFYGLASNLGLFLGPTIGGILLENVGFRTGSIFQWSVYVIICIAITTFSLLFATTRMSAREALLETQPDTFDEVTPLMKDSKARLSDHK